MPAFLTGAPAGYLRPEAFNDQGYDNLDELKAISQLELHRLIHTVSVKPGHVARLRRALCKPEDDHAQMLESI